MSQEWPIDRIYVRFICYLDFMVDYLASRAIKSWVTVNSIAAVVVYDASSDSMVSIAFYNVKR